MTINRAGDDLIMEKNESHIDTPVPELEKRKTGEGKFPTEEEIIRALTAVEDPELHLSIIDLGLVYKIDRNEAEGKISVDMTLTTPACPYGPQLLTQAHGVLKILPQVKEVKINTVWSPHWDPRIHASEAAQMMLGLI